MQIPCIPPRDESLTAAEAVFEHLAPRPVACCNWPQEFPYRPRGSFRMFHTGDRLWLRFDVEESYTKGEIEQDNGRVWTDSCVEFFLALDDEGYYNFEATCTGRLLVAFRREREHPTYAPDEAMRSVERYPSLGRGLFAEREGDNRWSLALSIPPQALFRHGLSSWRGLEAAANLYKCGDELSHPHFLSWKPIVNPKPDFHLPHYFGPIKFE